MQHSVIAELKTGSTWKLVGLSIVTFFVYAAHYMNRQTKILNAHCQRERRISNEFMAFVLIVSYLSLLLFIAYLFVDDTHPVAKISNFVDRVSNIAYLVWGFKARNRVNEILSSGRSSPEWFHGLWTFLFTPLYFNFKINVLNGGKEPKHA